MTEQDFIPQYYDSSILTEGSYTWKTPSNIALVKYWGKKDPQIPENTSISFTLNNCHTITSMEFIKRRSESDHISDQGETLKQVQRDEMNFEIYFEGEKKEAFKPKIASFFERIKRYAPI